MAFFIKAKVAANTKTTAVKKIEIIEYYEEKMYEILLRFKNDPAVLKQERLKFLKKVNQELSMNIFFNEEEAKDILNKLTNMDNK